MMIGRIVRRAAAVSLGALLSALACAAVAAGAVDGADVTRVAPSAPVLIGLALLTGLALAAVIRRLSWTPPSARAQRVSRWLRLAPELADVEVALALTAGLFAALAVTGGLASPA